MWHFVHAPAAKPSALSINCFRWLPFLAMCLLLAGCARDGVDTWIAQLQNPDVEVRRAAARALEQQTQFDNRVVVALTKTVADSDAEVRRLSINTLGKIGPPAASGLPALTARIKDTDSSVRLKAALAIQKIDPKNSTFQSVLITAMRAGDGRTLLEVGAMGKDAAWAVPTLIGLLSHESAKVLRAGGPNAGSRRTSCRRIEASVAEGADEIRMSPCRRLRSKSLDRIHTSSNSAVQ